jgi:hypothetical protein
MANILTGSYGNANEQVFYGTANAGQMESAQMIFPNNEKGTIGGGEFVTVTKYMTGMFGEKYPYVVTEFVPNKIEKIAVANAKVMDNIAYADDGGSGKQIGFASIGGGVGGKVSALAKASDVVGDGSVMSAGFGMVGGNDGANGGWGNLGFKPKPCPSGWTDLGTMCSEPISMVCDRGVLNGGMCMENNGFFQMPVGVPRTQGGSVISKF